MSYAAGTDHIKTGVRSAWLTVALCAVVGATLLSLDGHRGYDYRLDLMPVGLLLVAAIFTPVMIAAHIASRLGFRELSRRQCQVAKTAVVMTFALLWTAARALDIAARY